MSKLRVHPLFPYGLWVMVLSIVLAALNYKEPNWASAASLGLGLAGAVLLLINKLEIRERLSLVPILIASLAAGMLHGTQFVMLLMAAELVLVLSFEKERPRARMYWVLAPALLVFLTYMSEFFAGYFTGLFACLRLLIVPDEDRDDERVSTLMFGAVPVFVVLYVVQYEVPDEAAAILAGVALVNALFGRTSAALVAAFAALIPVEPKLFVFAGPLAALLAGGVWGIRAAAAICAACGILMSMHNLEPVHLAIAGLSGASAGLCWWTESKKKIFWPAFAVFAASLGAGIYFNQEWFLGLGQVSAPEELTAAGAFALTLGAGYWLRKFLPLKVKLKTPKFRAPALQWPKLQWSPRFELLGRIAGHQDFATLLFLVAATAAFWIARANV